jgi:two-component system response regulator HydG
MEKPLSVLLVDDEASVLEAISRILSRDGVPHDFARNGAECLERLRDGCYDVVLLDLVLPDVSGQELLPEILRENPGTLVVIVTGHATLANAVETLKIGAADFLAKPFSPDELRAVFERLGRERRLTRENELLRRQIGVCGEEPTLVGESREMQEIVALVDKVAPTDSTVLLTGESGTGKEVLARLIHMRSRRRNREFVPIDCTSLVETLLESELFGHVKGSFTGAVETKHGYFELADGGTMFFDEVGNLPLSIQAKLLRVLQMREFTAVGSTRSIPVDVRILAATNQELPGLIEDGRFRADLFYRLNVVPIRLPPLRQRLEDVPRLAEHFVACFNRRRPTPIRRVEPETWALLQSYHWPGNVRELENAIERALILEDGDTLTPRSLPIQLARQETAMRVTAPLSLEEMERGHISHVLSLARQNRSRAAKLLGVDRKTLYNKIRKYGL